MKYPDNGQCGGQDRQQDRHDLRPDDAQINQSDVHSFAVIVSVGNNLVQMCAMHAQVTAWLTRVQMQARHLHQKHGDAGKGNDGQGRKSHRLDYTGQEQGCTI